MKFVPIVRTTREDMGRKKCHEKYLRIGRETHFIQELHFYLSSHAPFYYDYVAKNHLAINCQPPSGACLKN